jgi:hypothetical protein
VPIISEPTGWDDFERKRGREPFVPFEFERPATKRLASGSFLCPSCAVPMSLAGPVSLTRPMRCPFCSSVHPARRFVRFDAYDTELNAVEVRARLPR